jgi:hypothetical protein
MYLFMWVIKKKGEKFENMRNCHSNRAAFPIFEKLRSPSSPRYRKFCFPARSCDSEANTELRRGRMGGPCPQTQLEDAED